MAGKSIKKNYFYNLIYQLFLLIVPLFVTPYIARVLGSYGSGSYAYGFSIITYFTIAASLGFTYYGQRAIAKEQGNKKNQKIIFWEIFLAKIIPTFLSVLIYLIIVFSNAFGQDNNYLMLALCINIIAVGFDISFYFQGNEDFGKLALINAIIKIISIVCIFLFVKSQNDIAIYAVIQGLCVIVSNLCLWVFVGRDTFKVNFKDLHPFKHFVPSLILFIPTIATTLYTSLDKTMIGIITQNPNENGFYDYADKIVKLGLTVISSLGVIMISKNSKLYASKDLFSLKNNINRTIQFVLAIGIPITLGLISISENLIPWYLGDGYGETILLLKVLSPVIIIIGLSNILGLQYLIPIGEDKKYTISIFIGVLTNFAFNFLLIYFFGSLGAAIATLIAELAVTTTMIIFCRNILDIKNLVSKIWKYLIGGILLFIFCYVESIYLKPSIVSSVIIIFTGLITYCSVLLILKEEFAVQYSKRLIICLKSFFTNKNKKNILKFSEEKNDFQMDINTRLLITGVNGQLGYDVCKELKNRGYTNVLGIDVNELDITDEKAVHEFVRNYKPDIIMHNAAWTAVDKAEENEDKVYAVNSLGTKYLADAAKEVGAKLMYISTDYVFDGKGENFFEVDSPKNGLSVYGKTKSKGEDFVTSTLKEYWIIRISWVFGINGNNFIRTMLKLAKAGKKELNVVDDQVGSPTYTYDLAKLMCDMIETNKYGVYHATNEGICSWYEFAKYIFVKAGYTDIKVNPVSTSEYKKLVPNQADRPLNSRLSKKSLDEAGFKHLPDWHDAVDRYIEELKEKGEF